MDNTKGYVAQAKNLMISPTKMRRVADVVRYMPYTEAVAVMDALPQKASKMLKKVVQSAAANALYQDKMLDEESLMIAELQVNEGPRLKRVWPRARGRRDLLLKRQCHVKVVVNELAGRGE